MLKASAGAVGVTFDRIVHLKIFSTFRDKQELVLPAHNVPITRLIKVYIVHPFNAVEIVVLPCCSILQNPANTILH